ncbi:MAG: hypothetical protein ACREI1_02905, partial [Nitrospiraceae bacterium]
MIGMIKPIHFNHAEFFRLVPMLDSSVRIHDRNKPSDNRDGKLIMPDLIKINAGFATIGQGAGPMMVTWKAGLFHKHGLDVARPPV